MENYFKIEDAIIKLHQNLKKFSNFSVKTRKAKILELNVLKEELKEILRSRKFDREFQAILIKRYKYLRELVNESIVKLKGDALDESVLENLFEQRESEISNLSENSSENEEFENMPPKLDIGTALKLVDKFGGEAEKLTGFFETLDLLKDYNEGVPEADLLKYVKTRLTGPAHGVINNALTIEEAKRLLKEKFAIKFSPQAIESEMASIKQDKKTISEYGQQINDLSAKLAAAHVSQGTFADEAAASAIVQPVAVKVFTNGLKDHKTQFFIKARNPSTLTKAISDALEVQTTEEESAMWMHAGSYRQRPQHSYRGRGNHQRGHSSFRRGNRGRGHGYRGRGRNFNDPNNYPSNHQQHNYHNNNNGNNHYQQQQRGHNNRGRQGHANVAVPAPQQRQDPPEEDQANLVDLFRD